MREKYLVPYQRKYPKDIENINTNSVIMNIVNILLEEFPDIEDAQLVIQTAWSIYMNNVEIPSQSREENEYEEEEM